MSRAKHRRRADHRRAPAIEPPVLIAILCEVLQRCPRCDAPLTYTPSGLCRIDHVPGCRLALEVQAGL